MRRGSTANAKPAAAAKPTPAQAATAKVAPDPNAGVYLGASGHDSTSPFTASSGVSDLPVLSLYAQPAVRARRASRLEHAGETEAALKMAVAAAAEAAASSSAGNKTAGGAAGGEKAPAQRRPSMAMPEATNAGAAARRSSVLFADAVSSNALPLSTLMGLLHAAISSKDLKATIESVAALGHLAMRGNADSLRRMRSSGAGHFQLKVAPPVSEMTLALSKAGAVEAILRGLNMMSHERELALRSLWALEHILLPYETRRLFEHADGRGTLRKLTLQHRWDGEVIAAINKAYTMSVEAKVPRACISLVPICACTCWPACCIGCCTSFGMVCRGELSLLPAPPPGDADASGAAKTGRRASHLLQANSEHDIITIVRPAEDAGGGDEAEALATPGSGRVYQPRNRRGSTGNTVVVLANSGALSAAAKQSTEAARRASMGPTTPSFTPHSGGAGSGAGGAGGGGADLTVKGAAAIPAFVAMEAAGKHVPLLGLAVGGKSGK